MEPHRPLPEYYADERERRRMLDGLFDATARHYDRIDLLLSLGSGPFYRRRTLRRLGLRPGMRVLDVAAGTGLLARAAIAVTGEPDGVVAVDPSRGMLAQARRRGVRRAVRALGDRLPFADTSFDVLSMGYGLRHVADLRATFAGYHRVLRPGGQLLLLELTRPRGRVGTALAKAYLAGIVPRLTWLTTGSAEAVRLMRYFWATIEHCVPPDAILAALRDAGFVGEHRGVSMGICSDYTATRPPR